MRSALTPGLQAPGQAEGSFLHREQASLGRSPGGWTGQQLRESSGQPVSQLGPHRG